MSVASYAKSVIRAPGQDNFQSGRRARFWFYNGVNKQACPATTSVDKGEAGFTLIELLVVIAIIAILAAILFPVFAIAKENGKQAKCSAQLKQVIAAVTLYTDDNNGIYVPAASDMDDMSSFGGHWRWHGYRANTESNFDPHKGPLWKYLSRSGGVKQCPSAQILKGTVQSPNAYEAGCGGFGYNAIYVGGTYYRNPWPKCVKEASSTSDITQASKTVMFTDTAMALTYPGEHLIEESFAYPPNVLWMDDTGQIVEFPANSPSIHFRHNGRANVGWCDGHVSSEKMNFTREAPNAYNANSKTSNLGWFGPDDNTLFDNK